MKNAKAKKHKANSYFQSMGIFERKIFLQLPKNNPLRRFNQSRHKNALIVAVNYKV